VQPSRDGRLLTTFDTESFFSVWYWVLAIAVWSQVCHRTLGIPYDMLLRANRLAEVADEVDAVAGIASRRLAAIHLSAGPWLAAVAGFVLAALGVLGFSSDYELAKAAFMLLLPLSVVALQTLRLAVWIDRMQLAGQPLRLALSRRRAWNQAIAILAIMATAVVALMHNPQFVLR
jgi:hypothetical protein